MSVREAALALHRRNQGKLAVVSKVPLRTREDLSLAYTPGVAEPCKDIKADKSLVYEYTCKSNMIAVVTDGTRVLGLGDIGPEAAMPVMEGKAVLFKVFGDVDAVPICLDIKDPDKFIATVKLLQPSFGGINLEDISSPKCYDIEDALIKEMDIPVFHDDQHGTAIAALAAVIGALRFVGKELKTARIVLNGAGAAGSAIGRLLVAAGVEDLVVVDRLGALYAGMDGLNRVQAELAAKTNRRGVRGDLAVAAKGADVLIGVSAPHVFTPEIIKSMQRDSIVIAMANPVPETSYDAAKAAGARVVGTGRSDAPNQVNNVSVFPGLFRGLLDVRAKGVNDAIKLAAAQAIADLIPAEELREDYVVPDVFDHRVAPAVAAAVAKAAMATGLARLTVDPEEVRRRTAERTAENY